MVSFLMQQLNDAYKKGEELRLSKIHAALSKLESLRDAEYAKVFPVINELNDLNFDLGREMWKFQGCAIFSNISQFLQLQDEYEWDLDEKSDTD